MKNPEIPSYFHPAEQEQLILPVEKAQVCQQIEEQLIARGYTIVDQDRERPWGAFFRVADSDTDRFLKDFFADVPFPESDASISPKILAIFGNGDAENPTRLSWQRHNRRGERWRPLNGPVAAYISDTDEHPEQHEVFEPGTVINVPQGKTHRLVGIEPVSIVAETWLHSDPLHPSNEEDIVRVADDYLRTS